MRDFFYRNNDIIIVLIILILAGLLIYNRVGIIMDYPAQIAEQPTQAAQQIEETDTETDTDTESDN